MFGIFLVVREIGVAQLLLGQTLRKPERHGAPLAGKTIDQQAKPFGATGYFVEKHRRPVVRRNYDIRRQTDFFLPRRSENGFQFAELFSFAYPLAQIGESDMRLNLRAIEHVYSLSRSILPTYHKPQAQKNSLLPAGEEIR